MSRYVAVIMVALAAGTAGAQAPTTMVPPAAPTIGASGGLGGGIALPLGRLADTHSAGYTLEGLIDFSAAEQPFSFRLELIYQRYDAADTLVKNMNITSLGGSLMGRSAKGASSRFLLGGIAVYRMTGEGTKPGVNVGFGLEVPLTFFVGMADLRVHYVLTKNRPAITIPVTLGARF